MLNATGLLTPQTHKERHTNPMLTFDEVIIEGYTPDEYAIMLDSTNALIILIESICIDPTPSDWEPSK